MSIRVRLVLSYLAMLFVPLVLITATATLIVQFYFKSDNPIRRMVEREAVIYADIKLMSIREPELFLQRKVTEGLDQRLSASNLNLIVRVNHEILFASPQLNLTADRIGKLPEFGTISDDDANFNEDHWITRHEDFLMPDKGEGSVFVVSDHNRFTEYAQNYIIWLFVILLFILASTNGVLTYLVSRGIVRPLKALHKATEEIKEGNLDYEVKPQSKDEIGKLSSAFEEMRKRLKESVELQLQYEENRNQLISNISHDLKTPVTAIKGYVEGIMDGVTNSPDKLDRYVKTIYAKAVDMDRMIDELFLISRLDLGKLPFYFEKVDIGAFLQDCAQELHFDMEKKGIMLELQPLLENTVFIKADREKLKRVLVNILENAMKYMDKADGRIGIQIILQEGRAVISVSDNGQGIAKEELSHIFDRFYRADPSRNSSTGGSGLGLSIAKQIVEEHGGLIGADSVAGEGTTVYVTLPVWNKREQGEG